jgi:hypothetical protein
MTTTYKHFDVAVMGDEFEILSGPHLVAVGFKFQEPWRKLRT